MDLSEQLLDRKAAAKMLGIDVKTINKLVELEVLQSYKIGTYRVFTKQFLVDFIEYLKDNAEDSHEFHRNSFVK
jgi:hypothetical protein